MEDSHASSFAVVKQRRDFDWNNPKTEHVGRLFEVRRLRQRSWISLWPCEAILLIAARLVWSGFAVERDALSSLAVRFYKEVGFEQYDIEAFENVPYDETPGNLVRLVYDRFPPTRLNTRRQNH